MQMGTSHRVPSSLHYSNLESQRGSSLEFLRGFASEELWPYRTAIVSYIKKLHEDMLSNSFKWEHIASQKRKDEKGVGEQGYMIRLLPGDGTNGPNSSKSEQITRFFEEDPNDICYDEPMKEGKKRTRCIKVISFSEEDRTLVIEELPPNGSLLYAKNFDIGIKRQQESIEKLLFRPEEHHIPLLLLTTGYDTEEMWRKVNREETDKWFILSDDSFPGVQFQREAAIKALSSPDFTIIEGPPGSGKTTVLTEIILQKLRNGERVLLVASTHIAVDNVLEKVLDHLEIAVPVRITSGARALDENISRYTYENFVETAKKEILERASRDSNKMSQAQKFWFQLLQGDRVNKIIRDVLNDSINLVCATTIGSLNFPGISEISRLSTANPVFDTMVIDEASKTTFSEFLVPALYCKKWVISGDPMQLSPYVDSDMLEGIIGISLRKSIGAWFERQGKVDEGKTRSEIQQIENACLDSFNAISLLGQYDIRNETHKPLICLGREKNSDLYRDVVESQFNSTYPVKQGQSPIITRFDEHKDTAEAPTTRQHLDIFSSDVLIADTATVGSHQHLLPLGTYLMSRENNDAPQMRYRNNYFYSISKIRISNKREGDLYGAISWRLKRMHELKDRPSEAIKFSKEISSLLPSFDGALSSDSQKDVLDAKKSMLPSIIECLLEGSEPDRNETEKYLTHGFPTKLRESRYALLEYQYRMHPDISCYPRGLFYTDSEKHALLDSPDVRRKREDYWSNPLYGSRMEWLDVKGREEGNRGRFNRDEAEKILFEFERFLDWSKNHTPSPREKRWSVAILSFYEKQTYLLKKMIRDSYGNIGERRRDISLRIGNVDTMQGREADVVYLSLVRTAVIGFLDNPNRINVAISRARYQMVIVGDQDFFKNQKKREDLAIVRLAQSVRSTRHFDFKGMGYDEVKTNSGPLERYPEAVRDEISRLNYELKTINEQIRKFYEVRNFDRPVTNLADLKKERSEVNNRLRELRKGGWNGS